MSCGAALHLSGASLRGADGSSPLTLGGTGSAEAESEGEPEGSSPSNPFLLSMAGVEFDMEVEPSLAPLNNGNEGGEEAGDADTWDAETRKAWEAFVRGSKVGAGWGGGVQGGGKESKVGGRECRVGGRESRVG